MTVTSSIDARVATLARQFHDVLTPAQLAGIGISKTVVRRLVARGWLHRYARGVYIVGSGSLTAIGRIRAAALAVGREARATAESTLRLFGIIEWEPRTVTVIAPCAHAPIQGVRLIRTSSLHPAERTVHQSVPTTTVERALVEMSAWTNPLRLLKYMRRARYLHRLDIERLEASIERLKYRGTTTNISRALRYFLLGDGGADSALEERMHALILSWGFREPRTNVHVAGLFPHERVDVVWHDERVIVEVDGPYHLDPDVQREDRRRDRAVAAAGYRVVRVWWWELDEVPRAVRARIAAALAAA